MREQRDTGSAGVRQASTEIIPETHTQLVACFHQREEAVAAIAAQVGAGAAGDFSPCRLAADIVFRAVGVQRDTGRSSAARNSSLRR